MSGFVWQDGIAAASAAIALGWLVRRRMRHRTETPCESCPAAERAQPRDFVALGDLLASDPERDPPAR